MQERLVGRVQRRDGVVLAGPDVAWIGRRRGRRRDRRWAKSWSPEQISNRLRLDFPDDESMRISPEAIYQSLYVQGRGALKRELTACLRTGRALRVPRARACGRGKRFVTDEVMISQRPAEAADRAVPGHWEGDLILGDWLALGRDLIGRGLGAPMLIVADGAPGLIKAVEQCWPASDRQHCAVHRVRNLLAKLPERDRERVRRVYWQALDDATGERAGKQRLQALAGELDRAGYTAAAKCLADDLDALVVHLRYPTRHRRRWRSTNLLERSLGEVKRRTKVIGRFPGETSCLTLVWAVLDLYISHATNGIKFTQLERHRLKQMRYEGSQQHTPEEVTAA